MVLMPLLSRLLTLLVILTMPLFLARLTLIPITSYDADNRPLLVMRSNLWASGYDVDGTDQTSLGQFSGRVQQTYKHSVPRFFVPEHGTMFTLALVRFPPTATKEIQYLNAK